MNRSIKKVKNFLYYPRKMSKLINTIYNALTTEISLYVWMIPFICIGYNYFGLSQQTKINSLERRISALEHATGLADITPIPRR